jgi:hypothetical protein
MFGAKPFLEIHLEAKLNGQALWSWPSLAT